MIKALAMRVFLVITREPLYTALPTFSTTGLSGSNCSERDSRWKSGGPVRAVGSSLRRTAAVRDQHSQKEPKSSVLSRVRYPIYQPFISTPLLDGSASTDQFAGHLGVEKRLQKRPPCIRTLGMKPIGSLGMGSFTDSISLAVAGYDDVVLTPKAIRSVKKTTRSASKAKLRNADRPAWQESHAAA